ncbi:MAG: hypothetical protein RID09_15925 [Coleofasciculus sp. G1-WW12-02]|uniref:hypothetical protein n=1 Tax=Coleofasciculus sp. G1-WW12-02 TaxID=3068483 RepID=UPI0032F1F25F
MKVLVLFLVLGIYGYGVWKLWTGFNRTNFSRSLPNRMYLSLLWPVLIVANKSYRKNFTKALKGR